MNRQLILVLIVGSGVVTSTGGEVDEDSEEITYQFERNSTYAQRQWNITLGGEIIRAGNHIEDCLLKLAPKESEWFSEGPLCKICSQAITIKFTANESITLRYAGLAHGILTFPESEDEILIDFILCSYDPSIGIDRLYLTRGAEVNSVHFIKTVGSRDDKYKFILDSNEMILGDH